MIPGPELGRCGREGGGMLVRTGFVSDWSAASIDSDTALSDASDVATGTGG